MEHNGLHMKYFVLNPTKDDEHGRASREALLAYANSIRPNNKVLANDLLEWAVKTEREINRLLKERLQAATSSQPS